MQEYSHVNELLADARFDIYELHSGQLIDQYVCVVQDVGDEFISGI
jgi:chromatin segregation and condensation protein Rec8/ScpA/Scc1 (kleisin family)